MIDVRLDSGVTVEFPPIHSGRYEVDPEATGLTLPLPEGLVDAVQRAGIDLLRVGVGCWLPSQDPAPEDLPEREWFLGTTVDDAQDPSSYRFTHFDRVLDVCAALDVELLLSIDSMPESLARVGPPPTIPAAIAHAAVGYTFPDGVRCAPPREPEVFAEAVAGVLRHVAERGVRVRYVELWNEPDLPFFYSGTFDDYLDTYRAFARRVAADGYLVGGPSWSGLFEPERWRDELCRAVAQEQLPMHFYSLHRYNDDRRRIIDDCRAMRATLDEHGLTDTELLLDEWGYDLRNDVYYGTVGNAAFTAACLMALPAAGVAAQTQVLLVDPCPVADGRKHGLTRRDGDANPVFYALEVFERFRRNGMRRITTSADDSVLAGVDDTGRLLVLVANADDTCQSVTIALRERAASMESHVLTQATYDETGGWQRQGTVTLDESGQRFELPGESLLLLEGSLVDA